VCVFITAVPMTSAFIITSDNPGSRAGEARGLAHAGRRCRGVVPTPRPAVRISSLLSLALVSQAGVFDRVSEIATPSREAFTA
jgi:hypothetical protein